MTLTTATEKVGGAIGRFPKPTCPSYCSITSDTGRESILPPYRKDQLR